MTYPLIGNYGINEIVDFEEEIRSRGVQVRDLALWEKTRTADSLDLPEPLLRRAKELGHVAVKESVFPFNRFYGVDTVLGPEMKSTGEVMGIDTDFGVAFAKSQIAAGLSIPLRGRVFISVMHKDKRSIVFIAKRLSDFGFDIVATKGTTKVLATTGSPCKPSSRWEKGGRISWID